MTVIQWICGICFALNSVINIYQYVNKNRNVPAKDRNDTHLNAAMGWFCALLCLF